MLVDKWESGMSEGEIDKLIVNLRVLCMVCQ